MSRKIPGELGGEFFGQEPHKKIEPEMPVTPLTPEQVAFDGLRDLDVVDRPTRKKIKEYDIAYHSLLGRLGKEPSSEDMATSLGMSLPKYHEWIKDVPLEKAGLTSTRITSSTQGPKLFYVKDTEATPEQKIIDDAKDKMLKEANEILKNKGY